MLSINFGDSNILLIKTTQKQCLKKFQYYLKPNKKEIFNRSVNLPKHCVPMMCSICSPELTTALHDLLHKCDVPLRCSAYGSVVICRKSRFFQQRDAWNARRVQMTELTVHLKKKTTLWDGTSSSHWLWKLHTLPWSTLIMCFGFFVFNKKVFVPLCNTPVLFHICCPWFRNSVTECDRLSAKALEAPAAKVHNLWISPKLLTGFMSLFCEELKHAFSFYLPLIWFLKTLCDQPGSLVMTSVWRVAGWGQLCCQDFSPR